MPSPLMKKRIVTWLISLSGVAATRLLAVGGARSSTANAVRWHLADYASVLRL